jgi:hypothetical protein
MIRTLAVEITEDTYPIAVACLPPGFALIKKKIVLGSYLVVNDLQFPDVVPDDGLVNDEEECDNHPRVTYNRLRINHRYGRHQATLSLTNFWTPKEAFKKDFKAVHGKISDKLDTFFEVERR